MIDNFRVKLRRSGKIEEAVPARSTLVIKLFEQFSQTGISLAIREIGLTIEQPLGKGLLRGTIQSIILRHILINRFERHRPPLLIVHGATSKSHNTNALGKGMVMDEMC